MAAFPQYTSVRSRPRFKVGLVEAPKLVKDNFGSTAVDKFIAHIHNLIRVNAFDDSVI